MKLISEAKIELLTENFASKSHFPSTSISWQVFLVFSVPISSVINLIFKGQMEYAIISFSVGEKSFAWLFHAFMFKEMIRKICKTGN